MAREFQHIPFIKKLLEFSPRQLEGETKAANFIKDFLKACKVRYAEQEFTTYIPQVKKAVLFADGKKIPCQACCFVSGKIEGKEFLVSSLIPSRFLIEKANINFNPLCPKAISCANHYFAPALAVPRDQLNHIIVAKNVKGEVVIKPKKHKAVNILVGNAKNPKTICFAHYDSINKGAIDNASGAATVMGAIFSKPQSLAATLYVFSANEELSYDKPTYWGHGFRVFEKKYTNLMERAKRVVVIDSLGNGPTQITQDSNLIYLGFPIENIKKWQKKIFAIFGDFQHLMSVYHSDADDMHGLKAKYLEEGTRKLLGLC